MINILKSAHLIAGLICVASVLSACGGESAEQDAAEVVEDQDCADPCDPTCADPSNCEQPEEMVAVAVAPEPGDLLIEELYYSGASPNGGTDHYFSDQFIELVNATDEPLDLSGVMIGDVYGAAGEINPGMTPDSFVRSHPDQVVLSSVWRIPDETRLEPGARLIVAHDGTNHRPFSTIDLSAAGFEAFVEGSGRDNDHPTVRNLESVTFNGGFDWLVPVFGASITVLAANTALNTIPGPFGDLSAAPASRVLDAVDALMDGDSGAFKRLPAQVDSGFAFVSGPYTGQSLHRVQTDGVWQDTGDSSLDFMVGPPDPYRAPDPEGVVGDVSIEIGTGYEAFIPLAPGDDVELIAGFQGGWHVDAAVRLSGVGPDGVLLVYDAIASDGERISFETQAVLTQNGLLPEGEGWVRLGDRIVMDILDTDAVEGAELTLRVTAQFKDQTWSDERTVVIVYDGP